jgi:hypothetical protein
MLKNRPLNLLLRAGASQISHPRCFFFSANGTVCANLCHTLCHRHFVYDINYGLTRQHRNSISDNANTAR